MLNNAQRTFSNERPRISDYQFASQEVAELMRQEDRIKNGVKLNPDEVPGFNCDTEFIKRLSNILYDMGHDHYH